MAPTVRIFMTLHTPPNRNTSLEKASRVLFAFDEDTPQLGVMDIARRVGLNKSTVSRFVASLTELGLLERVDGGRKVRLSLRLYEIGMLAVRHRPILGIVGSTLTRTAATIGETCAVGVLIGEEIVFLERAGGGRQSVRLELGRRFPADCSAAGQVLLAGRWDKDQASALAVPPADESVMSSDSLGQYHRVLNSGYATDFEGMLEGVNSISAPIMDRSGMAIAALAVLTQSARTGRLVSPHLVDTVTTAAAEVSRKLGYHRARRHLRRVDRATGNLRAEVG